MLTYILYTYVKKYIYIFSVNFSTCMDDVTFKKKIGYSQ